MNNTDFWGDETRRDGRAERSEQRRKAGGKKSGGKKRGGGAAALAALLFLVVVLGGGGYFGYTKLKNFMQPGDYTGEGAGATTIEVQEGDFTSSIAATLVKADVVKSTKAFTKAAEDEPKSTSIQPGFYRMRLKMSAKSALALMLDPKSRAGVVNVPEGRRALEIFEMLSKQTKVPVKEFEKVRTNPKALGLPSYAKGNLEGYLYPGQYNLPPKATAAQLLKPMVDRFKQQVSPLNLPERAKKIKMTAGDVVIMASLIEAEAGRPDDYRKISRVIFNRFKAGRNLEFDTPILYKLKKRTLDVRHSDLMKVQSPYNLYTHSGLTPGAISNPGIDAINAVFNPEKGTWLYFVATDPTNRKTEFATTEEEFKVLVAKFRAWQKKNPGN